MKHFQAYGDKYLNAYTFYIWWLVESLLFPISNNWFSRWQNHYKNIVYQLWGVNGIYQLVQACRERFRSLMSLW